MYNYGIKSGIEKEWNDDGIPKYENNWKDGLKDGVQILWGSTGLILKKQRYSKGMLHGEFIDYYIDGQKSVLVIIDLVKNMVNGLIIIKMV